MEEKVKNIISQILSVDIEKINSDFSKDTCSAWDSINQMALVTSLEEEFNIRFTDEEVLEILSYDLILMILKGHGVK